MNIRALACTLALSSAFATGAALSADVGQHPAVFAPRALPAVDPSTFLVGHPASPVTRSGHANFEHPAVAQARRAAGPGRIDSNTFLVQPPASTAWQATPAPDRATAAIATTAAAPRF